MADKTLAERYAEQAGPEPRTPTTSDRDDHVVYRKAHAKWVKARAKLIEAHFQLGEQTHRRIQERAAEGLEGGTISMREWDALRAYREHHGFAPVLLDSKSTALIFKVLVTVVLEEMQHGRGEAS